MIRSADVTLNEVVVARLPLLMLEKIDRISTRRRKPRAEIIRLLLSKGLEQEAAKC